MEKYSVLLVDDEEEVIRIIIKKIDWEALGFTVVGYADNGMKALELVEEMQPDVVMTDIRMPYMDGMELAGNIKDKYPETKLLIFTGFDEFEYAKEAIHLEVEEYILKPVNSMELAEIFRRLRGKLDREKSERQNVASLEQYYMDSLPLLQANFFTALIEGTIRENELSKYLQDYRIILVGPVYVCVVVHVSTTHVPENMSILQMQTSVKMMLDERKNKSWAGYYFNYLGNMVGILQLQSEEKVAELTDAASRFCRYAQKMLDAVVTVGIGIPYRNVMDVSKSYASAREAVSYRVIYGAPGAINIREVAPQEKLAQMPSDNALLAALFKAVRLGTEEEVQEAAEHFARSMDEQSDSLQKHYMMTMELVDEFHKFMVGNELPENVLPETDVRKIHQKLMDLDPAGLRNWIRNTSLAFRGCMANARASSTQSLIRRAENYVEDHYGDSDISLDEVSSVLGISSSYFSSAFKRETGNSFIGYLTDYRMKQAARLLLETTDKSYIIAGKVGYTDPNYFSYVFKRQFGVSPSKYRAQQGDI